MANFDDDTITGTINNFMGSDGMSRDWSVALKENSIGNTGIIAPSSGIIMTTWTMGGSAPATRVNGVEHSMKMTTAAFLA